MATAIFYHDRFAKDHLVQRIPEGPDRAERIIDKIRADGLLNTASLVSPEPCNLATLQLAHSDSYIKAVRESCLKGLPHVDYVPVDPIKVWYDEIAATNLDLADRDLLKLRRTLTESERCDVPIVASTFELALFACGAVVDACDLVVTGKFNNAFCIVRPPGHHAEFDMPRGFCIFNNIVVGAKHLLNKYSLERILIVDVDVHHGNGAQHSFYADDRVLVCNVHRAPNGFYPYNCGFEEEIGSGAGQGYNLNIPLEMGSGVGEYNGALWKIEQQVDLFKPQIILLSLGFDAHRDDNMGGMKLPTAYFGYMTERIVQMAKKHCEGKLISVLEGGYNREVLGDCASVHVKQLLK